MITSTVLATLYDLEQAVAALPPPLIGSTLLISDILKTYFNEIQETQRIVEPLQEKVAVVEELITRLTNRLDRMEERESDGGLRDAMEGVQQGGKMMARLGEGSKNKGKAKAKAGEGVAGNSDELIRGGPASGSALKGKERAVTIDPEVNLMDERNEQDRQDREVEQLPNTALLVTAPAGYASSSHETLMTMAVDDAGPSNRTQAKPLRSALVSTTSTATKTQSASRQERETREITQSQPKSVKFDYLVHEEVQEEQPWKYWGRRQIINLSNNTDADATKITFGKGLGGAHPRANILALPMGVTADGDSTVEQNPTTAASSSSSLPLQNDAGTRNTTTAAQEAVQYGLIPRQVTFKTKGSNVNSSENKTDRASISSSSISSSSSSSSSSTSLNCVDKRTTRSRSSARSQSQNGNSRSPHAARGRNDMDMPEEARQGGEDVNAAPVSTRTRGAAAKRSRSPSPDPPVIKTEGSTVNSSENKTDRASSSSSSSSSSTGLNSQNVITRTTRSRSSARSQSQNGNSRSPRAARGRNEKENMPEEAGQGGEDANAAPVSIRTRGAAAKRSRSPSPDHPVRETRSKRQRTETPAAAPLEPASAASTSNTNVTNGLAA
ncbi:hypothetical protein HK102_002426 [Quaeritorhiza haematococci]|nr:hypothetical protein HK102_002426 [Quaeritorhiza haematococci]